MVITGPLDFFTTLRSGDRGAEPTLTPDDSFAACCARASGVQTFPVITAAAPMTALRMRKDRRSIPCGITGSSGNSGNNCSLFDVFILTAPLSLGGLYSKSSFVLDPFDMPLRSSLDARVVGFIGVDMHGQGKAGINAH